MRWFRWKPTQETLFATLLFFLIVFLNIFANFFKQAPFFFVLYQGVLILGAGIVAPLWYIRITKQRIASIGLTLTHWKKAVAYGLFLACVSVPWRLAGTHISTIEFGVLVSTGISLMMTSFFEEVFFRGFIQTRFEKAYGAVPAIIVSALTFSLYHLGYPDYRNPNLLFVLFLVGLFFAVAFRITNNVITSFLVNLPHALISFIENGSYFSTKVAVVSGFTTIIGLFFIYYFYTSEVSTR
jgi:uncharacterized protein